MKRISMISIGALAAVTLAAGLCSADEPQGTPPSDPTAQAQTAIRGTADEQAQAHAADVLGDIRERAAKLDEKAAAKWNAQLDAAGKESDAAAGKDPHAVAIRLATEFGTTAGALSAEKKDLKVSWGQLVIAHTLMANSTAEVTAKQLFDLRTQGMGWGQIAVGMGLRLGDAVSAVKAEGRVAKGLDKADGEVAAIHGVGAKAGLRASPATEPSGAHVGAASAVKAGAATEHAKVGVGAGAGKGGK